LWKIIFQSNNLKKSFGNNIVFENLNLDIYNGDRIAFVGKNGCGKTTLTKIINGELDFEKDLEQNSEFRIKYPRGELGQSSGEAELFMLVEHMSGQLEKMETKMENMMSNTVNIERLQKDVEKVLSDIEKLKDKQRTFANGTR